MCEEGEKLIRGLSAQQRRQTTRLKREERTTVITDTVQSSEVDTVDFKVVSSFCPAQFFYKSVCCVDI